MQAVTANQDRSGLGVGYYTTTEAARILRVHPQLVRRWARDYRVRSRGASYTGRAVISPSITTERGLVLTFQDVIEMLFVKLFRDQGVSMPTIRAAAEEAGRLFHTDHPFAIRRFDTDAKRIFALLTPDRADDVHDRAVEDLAGQQMVIEEVTRPYFRKIDYDNDEAIRYWPMGRDKGVVIDARRAFGQPIIDSSGVPTRSLYEMVRGGQSPTDVARWYEIPEEDVRSAIEYEGQALAA